MAHHRRYARRVTSAPPKMIEVERYAADTLMVRNADGKYFPVADNDPRAKDAVARLMYPLTLVNGEAVPGSDGGTVGMYCSTASIAHTLLKTGAPVDFLTDLGLFV